MTHVNQRQLQIITIIGICIAILALTIAYAVMREKLVMSGSASVEGSSWDVHFEDISVSTVGNAIYTKPKIQGTIFSNFYVALTKTGDTVIYQAKVVNAGSVDAKITDIVTNKPVCTSKNSKQKDADVVCNNLEYDVTYLDGTKVQKNDVLPKNSYAYIKYKIAYPSSIVPNEEVSISNLGIYLIYTQN